jgi:hypothetical protein
MGARRDGSRSSEAELMEGVELVIAVVGLTIFFLVLIELSERR